MMQGLGFGSPRLARQLVGFEDGLEEGESSSMIADDDVIFAQIADGFAERVFRFRVRPQQKSHVRLKTLDGAPMVAHSKIHAS